MKIYKSIIELIGLTPLIELSNFEKNNNIQATILGKYEAQNPAGSVKDRVANEMIESAEKKGLLKSDSVLIEPTSGNTGIGLAAIASCKGYRTIIVMPSTMSVERMKLMRAYGAELVLSDGNLGMQGAIDKANELKETIPNSFIPGQFINMDNPKAHFKTTGPEIWNDTDGKVDIFVCGIGTGGTISGVGEYLKSKNPKIKIVGVEPKSSPVLTQGHSGNHKIQGIGAGFIPKVLNTSIYDEIIDVDNEDAFITTREIAKHDGLLVGISSGAALYGAKLLAQRKENKGKIIVVLFPDTGERYLSTEVFE